MKKLLCIISLLLVCLLLNGCSANDPIVTQTKNAWVKTGASGILEDYEVRHLHFDQLSTLKTGIGEESYQDYSWLPNSGDIFMFRNRQKWYITILDDQGNVCKKYNSDLAEAANQKSSNINYGNQAEVSRVLADLEEAIFFQAMNIWQFYIGEPSYENTPGEWHSLTDKQMQRVLK